MKIDQTICKARKDAHLPCHRCIKYQKCLKKGKIHEENTVNAQRKPHKSHKKTESGTINEVNIPESIKNYQKKERKNFTAEDIKILRDKTIPARVAAKMTGHHINSIYRWRKRNDISLPFVPYNERFRSNKWTEIELEIVKDTSLTTKQVQERINRSPDAIRQRRVLLGIRQGDNT